MYVWINLEYRSVKGGLRTMIPEITLPSQSRLLDLKLVEDTLFKIACLAQNQIDYNILLD